MLILGTDGGMLEYDLALSGSEVVSVDPREDAIDRARGKISALTGAAAGRVKLIQGDPLTTELEPESFDVCFLGMILTRQTDPRPLLLSALRLLRPGGTILISVPFGETGDPKAFHRFSLSSFADLVRPHCEVGHLSLSDDTIWFQGAKTPPTEQAWAPYSDAWMLQATESALRVLKRRFLHQQAQHRLDRIDILGSIRYRVGDLVVRLARRPWRLALLPLDLLRLYRARSQGTRASAAGALSRSLTDLPPFPAVAVEPGRRPAVAYVLDRFSKYCWQYEGTWTPASRRAWKEQFDALRPELFFMESAWTGNDGDWTAVRSAETGAQLNAILKHCRAKGIPAVFWNKEDPPNFNRFIDLAVLFDHIFTTASNCIPWYMERCGHRRVYALPFAAQPAIHNPMRPRDLPEYSVCFAGTWFAQKYPERAEALRALLEPALDWGLHIYDRRAPEGRDRFAYPEQYHDSIQGTLSYDQMLSAYRSYRVMLNVNSVPDSPTMFSRRVFESLACGTPVISSPSIGMETMLGGLVRVSRSDEETRRHLEALLGDKELHDREGHLGYRKVHREHTYAHRLRTVLEHVGLPAPDGPDWPRVTVILSTNRPANVADALDGFERQTYPDKELVLVLHGGGFDLAAIGARVGRIPSAHLIQRDESHALGQCLNAGLDLATGSYVAKMDDDDWYGPEYLWDLVLAARFSRAEITGKGVYFAHVQGPNRMGLRHVSREHDFVERGLAGGTLLVRRDVFDQVRFQALPRGTDAQFLRDCESRGFRFYSADRYNYVMVRRADPGQHTWKIDDQEVLRLCKNVRSGLDLGRAMI